MNQKQRSIVCDIDGTLALFSHRSPFDTASADRDEVFEAVRDLIVTLTQFEPIQAKLILLTGREEKFRTITEKWLKKIGIIQYDLLLMRPNQDRRKDFVVKWELYQKEIELKYDVWFVLEDRNQAVEMWRKEGLVCFQVAEGNF